MITGKILEAIEPLVIGIATKKHEPHLTLEEYCDLTIGMEPQNVAEINDFLSNNNISFDSFCVEQETVNNHKERDHNLFLFIAMNHSEGQMKKEFSKRIATDNIDLLRYIVTNDYAYLLEVYEADELINEGYIGMHKAIQDYDYSKGYQFSTYAVHQIKRVIRDYISKTCRTIRLPRNIQNDIKVLQQTRQTFIEEHGREASIEELSNIIRKPVEEIQNLSLYTNEIISLESPIYGTEQEGSCFYADILRADPMKETETTAISNMQKDSILKILESLPEKEQFVLIHRKGLYNETPKTLDDVGQLMGISRESVRQIEKKTLAKLQCNKELKKIAEL